MSQTHAIRARRFASLFDQLIEDVLHEKNAHPLSRMAIVVPSTSLRTWVIHRLTRALSTRQPKVLLGVDVVTLQGLAQRICSSPCPQTVDNEVYRLLLSRHPLPAHLSHIDEPEGLLLAIFRDLADAGFEPHHMQAAEEVLSATPWWPRGQSLLQAYVAWRQETTAHNLLRHSDIVQRATDEISAGKALPDEQLFWYGIYDLTGIMADFVATCCRRVPGRIYFPDFEHEGPLPAVPQTPDEYLRDVFDSVIQPAVVTIETMTETEASPTLSLFNASGAEAELEEVARRISAWAEDQGGDPPWTDVAVIARDLSGLQSMAEQVFHRFSIPVSLCRPSNSRNSGHVRRLFAYLDVIEARMRPSILFEALHAGLQETRPCAAYLGWLHANIRHHSVTTLEDWERLLTLWADGLPAGTPHTLPPEAVVDFTNLIRTLLNAVKDWPGLASIQDHLGCLESLVRTVALDDMNELLDAIRTTLEPTPVPIEGVDFLASVRRWLETGFEKTTANHGVWLLDVMAARGMTFSHVYLVEINRHQWPRIVRDDPLFPDTIRRQLRSNLGLYTLPVKERGHAEEALLFRHATQAANVSLTVSYLRADEEGKPLTASPFVDAIHQRCGEVHAVPRRKTDVLRPLVDNETIAHIPLADLSYWLAVQPHKAEHSLLQSLSIDPQRSALVKAGLSAGATRHSIAATLTDYDGLVPTRIGAISSAWQPLHPTVLERFLQCPWRGFVERVLKVQASTEPDEIPVRDMRLLGAIIHTVHEETVLWMREQSSQNAPISAASLKAHAQATAHNTLARELQSYAGDPELVRILIAPVLEGLVEALVLRLRQFIEGDNPRQPGDPEKRLRGSVTLEDGRTVELAARVDRLDQWRDGDTTLFRAVDLKAGARPKRSTRFAVSEDDLLALMDKGQLLQSAFYHWLAVDPPLHSAGYEYLDADLSTLELSHEGWRNNEAIAQAVLTTAADLLAQGAYVLRRDRHCQWCDVSATCARQHRPSTKRLELLLETESTARNPSDRAVKRYQIMKDQGVSALDEGATS